MEKTLNCIYCDVPSLVLSTCPSSFRTFTMCRRIAGDIRLNSMKVAGAMPPYIPFIFFLVFYYYKLILDLNFNAVMACGFQCCKSVFFKHCQINFLVFTLCQVDSSLT